jgi:hypothetical protein
MSDRLEWALAAADNLDRFLADAVDEDGIDNMRETMYTLAYDGALDAGADDYAAADIAVMLAGEPQ